jgi:hypothetical protein
MRHTIFRPVLVCAVALLAHAAAMVSPATAGNFGSSYYDRATDELVVTILYGGTNPNHQFTLKWGTCELDESGHRKPLVNGEILDDQFNDTEQQQYKVVSRFSLKDMPCPRPAIVAVSIAPNASFELVIPQ